MVRMFGFSLLSEVAAVISIGATFHSQVVQTNGLKLILKNGVTKILRFSDIFTTSGDDEKPLYLPVINDRFDFTSNTDRWINAGNRHTFDEQRAKRVTSVQSLIVKDCDGYEWMLDARGNAENLSRPHQKLDAYEDGVETLDASEETASEMGINDKKQTAVAPEAALKANEVEDDAALAAAIAETIANEDEQTAAARAAEKEAAHQAKVAVYVAKMSERLRKEHFAEMAEAEANRAKNGASLRAIAKKFVTRTRSQKSLRRK